MEGFGMRSEKEVAVEAAKTAGRFLLENFREEQKATSNERHAHIKADEESERIILTTIKKNFPKHSIFSEEQGLKQQKSDYLWIVDPLDGTTNYLTKIPFFNVSIALAKKKEIVLGVVYSPILDELFVAEKRKGAYLNAERIRVSEQTELIKSRLMTWKGGEGKPWENESIKTFLKNFRKLLPQVRTARLISASALELCYVACGRFEMFINKGSALYDYAAGALIVKEAGGTVTNFKGEPWQMNMNEVVASNKALNKKAIEIINN